MTGERLRAAIAAMPAIDQHAHLIARPGEEPPLARLFTESDDPAVVGQVRYHPSHWRALRELGAFAGTAPDEQALDRERHRRGPDDWRRALLAACRFEAVLVDDGFTFPGAGNLDDLAALVDCPVRRVLRLEAVAEERVRDGWPPFDVVRDGFRTAVADALEGGAVAVKTIAAYRCGLDLPVPDAGRARAGYQRWRASGRTLLEDADVVAFLLREAIGVMGAAPVPVQVHTGFGDADLDLRLADPLLLRPFLTATDPSVPFVLLHCHPFVTQASFLAGTFPNVYVDLSLAMTLVAHRGPDLVLAALEHAPASRLLFATDASRRVEGFFLGSRWWRDSLSRALTRLVDSGSLDDSTALTWAQLVLRENARRLYRLS